MPAKSAAQRRWAFAVKGAAWTRRHHLDTPGKLPARVKRKTVKKAKKKPVKRKAKRKKKRASGY